MTLPIDAAESVRAGEELDVSAIETQLRRAIPNLDGAFELAQFRKGHSNLTYLVRAGDREMVLRRGPFGSKVKSAHDMGREYRVLNALCTVFRPAPKPLAYFDDASIIGTTFYVMERIPGVILRAVKPTDLNPDADTVRRCCTTFISTLAQLHDVDYVAIGLESLRKEGQYVERQTLGWSERYRGSQTDEIESIDRVIDWLKADIPPDTAASLVHNDYKFDNIILDANDITRIVGVLDWEMATIGDPLADLGTALSYWVNPGEDDPLSVTSCFLTTMTGSMTRKELAARYAELTGRDTSNILYYYVLGLFKLAVIVQQIYYRYAKGLTKDERFAIMIEIVKILGQRAVQTIETGKM